MFANARGFDIDGSEFNDIAGNMNKTTCEFLLLAATSLSIYKVDMDYLVSGKNVAPNFGFVNSQSFS